MKKYMLIGGLVPLVWLLVCCASQIQAGGNCYGSGYYTDYYSQPVYRDVITPVAYPVPYVTAVPVISYLYNGGVNGNYSPVYQGQPAMQAGVVPSYQQPQQPQQASPSVNIDELIAKIEQRLAARQSNGHETQQPNTTNPPPLVPGRTPFVILHENCFSCHSTKTKVEGGVRIFVGDTLATDAPKSRIWDAADEGRMPPSAKKDINHALSDQDVAVLRKWMLSQ